MADGERDGHQRTDDAGRPLKPIRLSQQQRSMAVVGGVGLLGVGSWGFLASNQDGAGTVAFVAAGTLCGLLGVIGRVPTRLSGKDYSMELIGDADEVAEAALGVLTKEQMIQLVVGLDHNDRATSAEAAVYKVAASSLAYEEMVTNVFLIIANELQLHIRTHPNIDGFDLQLESSGKGRILVAIHRKLPGERSLKRQLHELSDLAKGHGARALIVTRSISTFGLGVAAELPRLDIIQGETDDELAPKIKRSLA